MTPFTDIIIGVLVAPFCVAIGMCFFGFGLSGRESDEERNRDLHFTYPNSMR